MRRVLVITGSRADRGLMAWPVKKLREDGSFDVKEVDAYSYFEGDLALMLGDREEILTAAVACHLKRLPIAHIAGGDVTEGSYDDAMRDCISRMASIHFVTSTSAMARLTHMGCKNVHLVGNPGIDYIRHANWKKDRPFAGPYVVVNYQVETIDGTTELGKVRTAVGDRRAIYIMPNPDRGSEQLAEDIREIARGSDVVLQGLPHDEYMNLIYHCDELIGNSSSMLYEAPELGVKTRMVGKRQRGRTIPMGDGHASERIVKILKYTL